MTTITTPLLGLRLTVKAFAPDARIGWHEHQAGAMCVLLRGDMREDMGEGECRHGPGDVVFKPAHVRHRNAFGSSGTSILTVALADRVIEQLAASDFPLARPFVTRATGIAMATRQLAVAMRNGTSLRCEALALQLLAAVRDAQAAARVSVRTSVQQIRIERAAKMLDEGLSIATVALELGYYDQSHFTRMFKKVTGLTPGAYQRTHRALRSTRG